MLSEVITPVEDTVAIEASSIKVAKTKASKYSGIMASHIKAEPIEVEHPEVILWTECDGEKLQKYQGKDEILTLLEALSEINLERAKSLIKGLIAWQGGGQNG